MASELRAAKSGFARDVQEKIAGKYDPDDAAQTLRWIRCLTPSGGLDQRFHDAAEKVPKDIQKVDPDQFADYLSDGLLLGYLMACLDSSIQHDLNKQTSWQVAKSAAFETARQKDRIGRFLDFCSTFGVPTASTFQTEQLYERTNLLQVVTCLRELGITAQARPGYQGPPNFWPQKHAPNPREFTEQQKRAGQGIISLQMGTTQGANASGISFGSQRRICDTH